MATSASTAIPSRLVFLNKQRLQFYISPDSEPADAPPSPHSVTSEQLHTTDVLIVTSNHKAPVAYKVKTTNHPRYIVRPNAGLLGLGESVTILIGVQESKLPDYRQECKDKFKILAAEAESDDSHASPDFWERMTLGHAPVSSEVVRVSFASADAKPSEDVAISSAAGVPLARDLPPSVVPRAPQRAPPPVPPVSEQQYQSSMESTYASKQPETISQPVPMPETDDLLKEGKHDTAVSKVRELNELLDEKNLELAQLKTELAEAKAEIERVLKEAPKTPLAANKVVSDPFGGVSIAGFGLMILLFAILVGVIVKVF